MLYSAGARKSSLRQIKVLTENKVCYFFMVVIRSCRNESWGPVDTQPRTQALWGSGLARRRAWVRGQQILGRVSSTGVCRVKLPPKTLNLPPQSKVGDCTQEIALYNTVCAQYSQLISLRSTVTLKNGCGKGFHMEFFPPIGVSATMTHTLLFHAAQNAN